jgi:RimJ/RimL family protein N-acetyltransferase
MLAVDHTGIEADMTGLLHLRDVREEDLPIFFIHQADTEAARMAAFTPRDQDVFMAHWAKILSDEKVDKQTILFDGRVAGNIVSFEVSGEREVGYWIGKEYWGRGIATQALREFLKQVKSRPLYAHAAKHNLGSLRVLEKCGFTCIGEDAIYSALHGADVEEYILILSS